MRAAENSYLYESIRAAGLITLGRTNTPEFGRHGHHRTGWRSVRPETRGTPSTRPGGSSGGSAAAVAAGMVPMAHAGRRRWIDSRAGERVRPGRAEAEPGSNHPWSGARRGMGGLHDRWRRIAVGSRHRRDARRDERTSHRRSVHGRSADASLRRRGRASIQDDSVSGWPRITQVSPPIRNASTAVERAGALLEALGHDVEVAQPDAFFDAEFSRHFVTIVAVATAIDFATMGDAIGRPIVEARRRAEQLADGLDRTSRSRRRLRRTRSTGSMRGLAACKRGGTISTSW